MRNMDQTFNKKRPIQYTVKINTYYQEYRERTVIDVIGRQKWIIILRKLQLAYYNSEIYWKTGEVEIIRYLEECRKQQRLKQGKSGQQKQKEKEAKEEKQQKKQRRKKEIRKAVKEWEIQNDK